MELTWNSRNSKILTHTQKKKTEDRHSVRGEELKKNNIDSIAVKIIVWVDHPFHLPPSDKVYFVREWIKPLYKISI